MAYPDDLTPLPTPVTNTSTPGHKTTHEQIARAITSLGTTVGLPDSPAPGSLLGKLASGELGGGWDDTVKGAGTLDDLRGVDVDYLLGSATPVESFNAGDQQVLVHADGTAYRAPGAGSLYTEKFDVDDGGWVVWYGSGTMSRSTTKFMSGTHSLKMIHASNLAGVRKEIVLADLGMVVGGEYRMEALVNFDVTAGTGYVELCVEFWTGAGFTGWLGADKSVVAGGTFKKNVWVPLLCPFTVPATATHMSLCVGGDAVNAITFYVDNVKLLGTP